jgi:hypothetical protein
MPTRERRAKYLNIPINELPDGRDDNNAHTED